MTPELVISSFDRLDRLATSSIPVEWSPSGEVSIRINAFKKVKEALIVLHPMTIDYGVQWGFGLRDADVYTTVLHLECAHKTSILVRTYKTTRIGRKRQIRYNLLDGKVKQSQNDEFIVSSECSTEHIKALLAEPRRIDKILVLERF